MPLSRQPAVAAVASQVWPSGGRHLWRSGSTSATQSHDRGHLVYAASGVLALHVADGTSVVPANRVAWTPANVTHRHSTHGTTDMRIVFLSPAMERLMPDQPEVFFASGIAREILLALTTPDSDADATPPRINPARNRLVRVLIDELDEPQNQPLRLAAPRDERLRAIAERLHADPSDNSTLAELGRHVGASARTLSRLFSSELAMTFYEWRTQLRIYHALVLLAEGHDTTHTAYACGWANPSSFIAAFSGIIGCTPGRYRDDPALGGRNR